MRVIRPQNQLLRFKSPASANKLGDVLLRFLRGIVSVLAVSAFCQRCQTKLELSREEVIHWSEDHLIQGIRFWRCPNCGEQTQEGYKYFVEMYNH